MNPVSPYTHSYDMISYYPFDMDYFLFFIFFYIYSLCNKLCCERFYFTFTVSKSGARGWCQVFFYRLLTFLNIFVKLNTKTASLVFLMIVLFCLHFSWKFSTHKAGLELPFLSVSIRLFSNCLILLLFQNHQFFTISKTLWSVLFSWSYCVQFSNLLGQSLGGCIKAMVL